MALRLAKQLKLQISILLVLLLVAPGLNGALAQSAATVQSLVGSGDAHFRSAKFKLAGQDYRRAWLALPKSAAASDRRAILIRIAQVSLQLRAYRDVVGLLKKNWRYFGDKGDLTDTDRAHYILMTASGELGDHTGQVHHARAMVKRYTKRVGPDHPGTLDALLNLGTALVRADKASEGRRMLTSAFDAIAGQDVKRYQARLNMTAVSLNNSGHLDVADGLFLRLIKSLEEQKPGRRLGMTYYNYGVLKRDQRDLDGTVTYHKKAIDLLEQVDGPAAVTTISAIAGLGNGYIVLGRPTTGVRVMERAFKLAMKTHGDNNNDTWIIANNLANGLREIGRYKSAHDLDKRAYEWRRKALGPADVNTQVSQKNLALDLVWLNKADDAYALFEALYQSNKKRLGSGHPTTLDAEQGMTLAVLAGANAAGGAKQRLAKLDAKAISRLDRATANLMSGLASKRGKRKLSLRLDRQAFAASEKELGPYNTTTLLMMRNVARAQGTLAPKTALKTYADLNDRMLRWSRWEISAAGGPELADQIRTVADGMIKDIAFFARVNRAAAPLLAQVMMDWKGIGVAEGALLRRVSANPPSVDVGNLATRIQMLRAKIARASISRRSSAGADPVERKLVLAEARMAKLLAPYRRISQAGSVGARDVSKALKPGEVLLDYLIIKVPDESGKTYTVGARADGEGQKKIRHLYVLVMSDKGIVRVKDLGPYGPIEKLLEQTDFSRDKTAPFKLFKMLLVPVLRDLDRTGRIFIVPDGSLYLVPFDGLEDANGRPVVDRYDVRVLRNARAIVRIAAARTKKQQMKRRLLLVGDPEYGPGPLWTPLPGTAREIETIDLMANAARYQTTKLSTAAASEEAVRAAARNSSIVHLATHGFFFPKSSGQPDGLWRAGIGLAKASSASLKGKPIDNDGIAWAAEIVDWPLAQAELVVLSACSTAQGDRSYVDGLRGMPTALAVAGAKRSILALWPVLDRGAASFMVQFYSYVFGENSSYEAAFRKTKLDAIAGKIVGAEDPSVWRAFVLITN